MSTAFEARGEWPLQALPPCPEPWMILGQVYVVVLKRESLQALPRAEIRDRDSDEVLGSYSWQEARELFGLGHA